MSPFVVKSSPLKVISNTAAGLSNCMNPNLTHAACLVLFLTSFFQHKESASKVYSNDGSKKQPFHVTGAFSLSNKGEINKQKGSNLCVYLLSGGEEVLLKLSPVGGSGPESGGLRARSSRFSWAVHTPPASGVHLPGGPRASVTAADCRSGNSSQSSQSLEEQEETRPCSSWCGSEPRPSPLSQ